MSNGTVRKTMGAWSTEGRDSISAAPSSSSAERPMHETGANKHMEAAMSTEAPKLP